MKISERIKKIPPYIFAQIDEKKAEAKSKGIDIVDLGIGDPDLPTPKYIIDAMSKSIYDPSNHNYPPYKGTFNYRKAVADWYKKRFGVSLDPDSEVLSLIGSKEGIAHAFLAFLDPGDIAILPEPGYPAYKVNTLIAGGVPYIVPVKEENNYEINFSDIEEDIAKKAKLIFLNYPQNPTGAIASDEFLNTAIAWAKKYDVLICMDLAYSEVSYQGYKPKSILEYEGAKDIAIEFHSLSKTFNMTGWRIGMVVGNSEAIGLLGKIKTNMDSGVFKAIQEAGIVALSNGSEFLAKQNAIYEKRINMIVNALNDLGANIQKPKATYYIWAKVPKGFTSTEFTIYLLEKTGVLVVPGNGYGDHGEGYFRISITASEERIQEAIKRLKEHNIRFD